VTRLLISWGPATLWAAALFYLSSQSDPLGASTFPLNDKVAHLIMFGVLGAALAWGGRRSDRLGLHAGLLFLGFLFAASDEWHQASVPLRDPSAWDFGADALGIILGFLFARALLKARRGPGTTQL
jgi:VanZ family protein